MAFTDEQLGFVVRVIRTGDGNDSSVGTGILVSPNAVVTCAHNVLAERVWDDCKKSKTPPNAEDVEKARIRIEIPGLTDPVELNSEQNLQFHADGLDLVLLTLDRDVDITPAKFLTGFDEPTARKLETHHLDIYGYRNGGKEIKSTEAQGSSISKDFMDACKNGLDSFGLLNRVVEGCSGGPVIISDAEEPLGIGMATLGGEGKMAMVALGSDLIYEFVSVLDHGGSISTERAISLFDPENSSSLTRTQELLSALLGAPSLDSKEERRKHLVGRLEDLNELSLQGIALRLLNEKLAVEFFPQVLKPIAEEVLQANESLTLDASKCREHLESLRPEFTVMKSQVPDLPFPVRTIAEKLERPYENFVERSDSSDDGIPSIVNRMHQLMSSWPRFSAASSLALLWSHLPEVGSTCAAKMRLELSSLATNSQREWQKTSSVMTYIKRLCIAELKKKESVSDDLLRKIDDQGFVFAGFGPCESDAACWAQIMEMDLPSQILRFSETIQATWGNFEIVVPTRICPDGTKVLEILRYDRGTGAWFPQESNLLLQSSEARSTRIDPWDGVVFEKQSPIAIRSSLLSDSGAESVAVGPSDGFSLFPFACVDPSSVNANEVPAFLLFDGLQIKNDKVNAIEYVVMTGSSDARRRIGRRQSPTHLDSFTSFLSALRTINPNLKLDVTPRAIDVAHEYVLCSSVIGRDDEMRKMTEWLRTPTAPSVFCWKAWGGDGKSAMVNEWLYQRETLEVLKDKEYQEAIWATFYEPDFDIHAFARKALDVMRVDAGQLRNSDETIQLFLSEASRRKFLFVLDGFERLLESESEVDVDAHELIRKHGDLPRELRMCRKRQSKSHSQAPGDVFLEGICNLPRDKSRFLITSRFCPTTVELFKEHDQAIVEPLKALTDEQAEQIWWVATGRDHYQQQYDSSELDLVNQAVQNLNRHPLVIGIVASTVGQEHFADYSADLRRYNNLSHTPFEKGFKSESGENDPRTRCSEALWYCGKTLNSLEREILVALQNRGGSSSFEDLLSNDYLLEELGHFDHRNKLDQNLQALRRKKWIGISQSGRIDIHPMVRQFAKKERDNRGYTKRHRLGPQEFSDKIRQIKKVLRSSRPDQGGPDAAWNEINRLDLWDSVHRLKAVTTSVSSPQLLCDLLSKFFSGDLDTSQGYRAFPNLSNRISQFNLLLHIGGLESAMGRYETARGTLQWAMELAKWIEEPTLVDQCRNSLQWLAMYQGNLAEAEKLQTASSYSPQVEVVLSLRGAESTTFASTPPSESAFKDKGYDRRWVFQTCAEAEFWRGRLEPGKRWLALMEEAIQEASWAPNSDSKPPHRGQVMWENWTRGVFEVESMIRTGDFAREKCDLAIENLREAGREASEYCYPIVEALALAFEIRLYGYLGQHDSESESKAYQRIDSFQKNNQLYFPIAVSLVRLAKAKLAANQHRFDECKTGLAEFWCEATLNDNSPFFLSLVMFDQLLDEVPEVEFKHRDDLSQKIKDIAGGKKVEVADFDDESGRRDSVFVGQEITEASSRSATDEDAKRQAGEPYEWERLKKDWGDEIAEFFPLAQLVGGDASKFEAGLKAYMHQNDGKLDPLGGLIEMQVANLEQRNANVVSRLEALGPFLDDLRSGLRDWSDEFVGRRYMERIERLVSSETDVRDRFLDTLLRDDMRLLKVESGQMKSYEEWCRLIVYEAVERNDVATKRHLLAFFESLMPHEVDLQRLITSMRLPSRYCYIAGFIRVYTDRFLQIMLDDYGHENKYRRERVELAQMQFRCGWNRAPEHIKSWWQQISKSNFRSSVALLRQLDDLEASLEQLFRCVEETGSENLQGNLYFLKYKRRQDLRQRTLDSGRKLRHADNPIDQVEWQLRQDSEPADLPLWDS